MLIIIFLELGKSEAMNLMQNIDLAEKVKHHKNILKINIKNNSWSCKFTENFNLNKKVESYKLEKVCMKLEIMYKNGKNNYKIW